jgi:predicted RNase H-like HicB family nuclease
MVRQFTGLFKKSGKWYLGWIEEIPGVNTQGKTLAEAKESLVEALHLVLETNKILSKQNVKGKTIRENISVSL